MKRFVLALIGLVGGALVLSAISIVPGRDRLPCYDGDLLAGNWALYCVLGRNYVRDGAVEVIADAHAAVAAEHGPSPVTWLDASGPVDLPLWPHRSHEDGKQIDLALYYEDREGRPIPPPTLTGYFAYEPPRPEERRPCGSSPRPLDLGSPDEDRNWRWDQARTTTLIQALISDARVRRVFIEPHLADRMGLAGHAKVRFAGCNAARHDDHIHIDLF